MTIIENIFRIIFITYFYAIVVTSIYVNYAVNDVHVFLPTFFLSYHTHWFSFDKKKKKKKPSDHFFNEL